MKVVWIIGCGLLNTPKPQCSKCRVLEPSHHHPQLSKRFCFEDTANIFFVAYFIVTQKRSESVKKIWFYSKHRFAPPSIISTRLSFSILQLHKKMQQYHAVWQSIQMKISRTSSVDGTLASKAMLSLAVFCHSRPMAYDVQISWHTSSIREAVKRLSKDTFLSLPPLRNLQAGSQRGITMSLELDGYGYVEPWQSEVLPWCS